MSAAVQLPPFRVTAPGQAACHLMRKKEQQEPESVVVWNPELERQPAITLAFYRKHTESLLRRYLYASMLVGRSPSMLDHPIARGWASSRPVHSFEDAVNFVLDVERCVSQLSALDRLLLSRIVLQEYTVGEASLMLGINVCTAAAKLSLAVDRLTEILIKANLLLLPH